MASRRDVLKGGFVGSVAALLGIGGGATVAAANNAANTVPTATNNVPAGRKSKVTPVSFIGASFLAAQILAETKRGQEGHESFFSKISRHDQFPRVGMVMQALNTYGVSRKACEYLQVNYFRDVSRDELFDILNKSVNRLQSNRKMIAASLGVDADVFGSLDFSQISERHHVEPDYEDEDEDNEWDEEDCDDE